jgi:hypothetical protein
MQNPYEGQIITPRELQKHAVVKIPLVTFEYCIPEDHIKKC